ncbi:MULTISPECIES: endonuclease/exonuclease/phosphatase family protein [Chitinophagaceae]
MKKCIFLFFLLSCFFLSCGNSQRNPQQGFSSSNNSTSSSHITIVNWNIEWFGSTRNGPKDLDLQEVNVQKVLQYLHANLYGLCEVVDVDRLQRVVKQLGNQYDFVVADYAAGVRKGNAQALNEAQKMAFVYDSNMLKDVQVRGFMEKSSRAGYNFSNGRYPFLLEGTIRAYGKDLPIAVLLIHAKAGADQNSYTRRLQAANEMRDSINGVLAHKPLIIMGDYNDVLQGSISGKNLTSPYDVLLQNGNVALTSLLSPVSGGTTLHYPTIIDNQIVNKELGFYYVKGSVAIRTDVTNVVRNFKNGKTSDHYPVSSSFDLAKAPALNTNNLDTQTTIKKRNGNSTNNSVGFVHLAETSFQDAIEITVLERKDDLQFVLYNSSNEKVLSVHRRYIEPGKVFFLRCKELPSGDYTLVVFEGGNKNVFQVRKN